MSRSSVASCSGVCLYVFMILLMWFISFFIFCVFCVFMFVFYFVSCLLSTVFRNLLLGLFVDCGTLYAASAVSRCCFCYAEGPLAEEPLVEPARAIARACSSCGGAGATAPRVAAGRPPVTVCTFTFLVVKCARWSRISPDPHNGEVSYASYFSSWR